MSKVTSKGESELLNISQAAVLLSVSKVSLRRWTDSGKLSCLRVGGKRERRFRRDDLYAFMESQAATVDPAAGTSSTEAQFVEKVIIEGIPITDGSHLCSLYDGDMGRVKLSVPYLAEGLRGGSVSFLIASKEAQDHILGDLAEVHGDLTQVIESGQLIVSDGQPSADAMYDFLERQFVLAVRSGNRSMRLLGDMAWALKMGMDIDELMQFEMQYNHSLARRYPLVSLCQYDVREFPGTGVHGALKCHGDTFDYPLSRFI